MWQKVWIGAIGSASPWFAVGSVAALLWSQYQIAIYAILCAIYCQMAKNSGEQSNSK